MPDEFLDTNVLVYAFSTDARAATARELLARGCLINVQVLNEFANVARRKLQMSWTELAEAVTAIRTLCLPVAPMTVETHSVGLARARRYSLSVFDGLVVAAALEGRCGTLWSQDMQHGLIIDGRLTIRNPFV